MLRERNLRRNVLVKDVCNLRGTQAMRHSCSDV
jgi:hypothetical protein